MDLAGDQPSTLRSAPQSLSRTLPCLVDSPLEVLAATLSLGFALSFSSRGSAVTTQTVLSTSWVLDRSAGPCRAGAAERAAEGAVRSVCDDVVCMAAAVGD